MSIDFGEVFTSFTSSKYNKTEMLIYIAILIASCFVAGLIANIFVAIVVMSFIFILNQGYIVVLSHNEAFSSRNVFPSYTKIGEIFIEGFKYLTGVSTLIIIINLPIYFVITYMAIQIINATAAGNVSSSQFTDSMFGCLLFIIIYSIISFILNLAYVIPAKLMFMQTLNLSDMFSFQKIKMYGQRIKKDFWMYFWYSVIISILINIVVQSVMGPVSSMILSPLMMNIGAQKIQSLEQALQLLMGNMGSIITSCSLSIIFPAILNMILMPNLNGQIIKNTVVRKKRQNISSDRVYHENV